MRPSSAAGDSPLLETNRSPTRWGVGGPPTFPRPAETPPLPAPAEGGPPARSPGVRPVWAECAMAVCFDAHDRDSQLFAYPAQKMIICIYCEK